MKNITKNIKNLKNRFTKKNFKTIFPSLLTNIILVAILIVLVFKILNIDENRFNLNIVENFTSYKNICENKVPQFYTKNNQIGGTPKYFTSSTNLNGDCANECTNDLSCIMYTFDDSLNKCNTYTESDVYNKQIFVNCAAKKNRIINNDTDYSNFKYLGEGFIKNDYYNNNSEFRAKFEHIDYLLDKGTKIKDEYMSIKSNISNMTSSTVNSSNIDNLKNSINNSYRSINTLYDSINNFLKINTDKFYSKVNPDIFNLRDTSMNFMGESIGLSELYQKMHKLEKTGADLDGKLENDSLEYNRHYLIYTILFFIMIITTILLIIFKFAPNIINSGLMLIYFIGIIAMLFFLKIYLKF